MASIWDLALDLFPDVAGIIGAKGALHGGGGAVFSAINAILGLPEVRSRSIAAQLFTFTRQAMLAGELILPPFDDPTGAAQFAPINPRLFGAQPRGRIYQYGVVIEWNDPFTGERATSRVDVESSVPLNEGDLLADAGLEVSDEYGVDPEDVQFIAPSIVAVQSVIRRF